jgi:hypothetical protein
MVSKKDMLTLGVLAIGGVAVASSFAGGDGGGDILQPKKGRAGGILGSQEGYGAPAIYNLPAHADVTFPAAPTFDISKFLAPQTEVPGRGAAGVSAAPKKYIETGKVGVGYEGYVTPTTPTPIAPPYIPGVTTFVPYKEPAYVPSPVKGGFLGTGMGQEAYKSQFAHRTYSTGAPAKKTSTDASKAIAHAKRLRAGRSD